MALEDEPLDAEFLLFLPRPPAKGHLIERGEVDAFSRTVLIAQLAVVPAAPVKAGLFHFVIHDD
jgi:hypothetical protein